MLIPNLRSLRTLRAAPARPIAVLVLSLGTGLGTLSGESPASCPSGTGPMGSTCVDTSTRTAGVGAALSACRARGLALLDEHTALAIRARPQQRELPTEFWIVSAGKVYRFHSRTGNATLYAATTPEVTLPYYCMSPPESRPGPPDTDEGCTDSDANACSSILHVLACLFWSSRK